MLQQQLIDYIRENEQLLKDLRLVRDLNLPDCYIAAGYIRNYVWDRLHGFDTRNKHNDIDVVYFDKSNISEEKDRLIERKLIETTGNEKWSVKNQARMHDKNGDMPYISTEDALSKWPETVTAVGARIDANDVIHIVSPYGLEDLFDMIVRRSPLFHDHTYYLNRVKGKGWKYQWPMLKVIEELQ